LTFRHANRVYHLIVDAEGQVIEHSTQNVGVPRSRVRRRGRDSGV
jgi:hypothetical protein